MTGATRAARAAMAGESAEVARPTGTVFKARRQISVGMPGGEVVVVAKDEAIPLRCWNHLTSIQRRRMLDNGLCFAEAVELEAT